ncbi:FAD-dependent oxidoreductase [Fodinicurvata sp. EGI_FJ10296]|uniref:NAD(P)/FAD-dependent oxidoreductase n=1 Tax=Fodinicurvata sp. EGI_FJ10296 TaxID=3231908 RepID=UPI003451A996
MSGFSSAPEASPLRQIVIIGAGAVGAATALNLRRKGFETTIVDSQPPGHGCSFGNAGAISPGSVAPIALPGMFQQVPKWLIDPLGPLFVRWRYLPQAAPWLMRWVAASRMAAVDRASDGLRPLVGTAFNEYEMLLGASAFQTLFRRQGQLYVWESDTPSKSETVGHQLRARHGIECHWLRPEEIRQYEPGLAPIFARGLFLPNNGHTIQPLSLVETMIEQYLAEGGKVERGHVADIRPHDYGTVTVHLDDGRSIDAARAVLAAGAWSARIAKRLGVRIPLETERGYHVMLPHDAALVRRPIMNADRGFIVSPMSDGMRVAGTVEIAGVDAPPDYRRAQSLLHHARAMFPDLRGDESSVWMGRRPSLPDSIPVIGPCPTAPSVVFAFGHGHLGITGAAMTGRLVSEIINNEPTAIDIAPYRPERFTGG